MTYVNHLPSRRNALCNTNCYITSVIVTLGTRMLHFRMSFSGNPTFLLLLADLSQFFSQRLIPSSILFFSVFGI